MKIFQKIKKGETRILKFCGITVFIYKKKRKHIRYAFKEVGSFVNIGKGSRISHSENIILKSNIHIGEGVLIEGIGGVFIGDNVVFGPDVTIWSANHNYYSPNKLPYDETVICKSVIIDRNVWIGAKSIITPGIHIGEGAVVAMGSVVVKDISKGAVVGGNPAKILKYRDLAQYDKLCSEESFYNFCSEESFYNFCGENVNRILIKNQKVRPVKQAERRIAHPSSG